MSIVKWFAHVNVNCRDLARSSEYYGETFGLTPTWHTAPPPQDGAGMGLAGIDVQWQGQLLTDARGLRGPVLDLLEWKNPPPPDTPSHRADEPGFHRLVFAAPDLDAVVPTTRDRPSRESVGAAWTGEPTEAISTTDPDGTPVQVVMGGSEPQLLGVRLNTTDLGQATAFFTDILGFTSQDEHLGDLPKGAQKRTHVFLSGNRKTFRIELAEVAESSTDPGKRDPSTIGIFRTALIVDDIDEGYEHLQAHDVPCLAPPVDILLGEDVPTVRALFFLGPEGCVLEYIEGGLA